MPYYEEAIKCYKKNIEIKSDDHEAWNNLGTNYFNLQNYEEAIKCYKKAIEIQPKIFSSNLVFTHIVKGNMNEAKSDISDKSLEKCNERDFMNISHILLIDGDKRQAFINYKKGLSISNNPKNYFEGMVDDYQYLIQYDIDKDYYYSIIDELKKTMGG